MKKALVWLMAITMCLICTACGCRHQYEDKMVVQPTCNAVGVKIFTCTSCEDSYIEEIPATGEHIFGATQEIQTANCQQEGLKQAICTVCGVCQVVETIPVKDHNYDLRIVKQPTCVSEGEGIYTCTVCQYSYKGSIEMGAHSYVSQVVKEPTCVEIGKETSVCSVCNFEYSSPINATGKHVFTSKIMRKATCTEVGEILYTCTGGCGYEHFEDIAKEKHDYTSKTTKAATCTAKGEKVFTCKDCGHSYSEDIKIKDHDYTSKTTKTANCTDKGEKVLTCKKCSHTYTESVSAKGHKWVDATCTKAKYCSTCKTVSGKALGHDFGTTGCRRCGTGAILLPDTPIKLSDYDYKGRIDTTVKITGIEVVFSSYYSGKYIYTITVAGVADYNSDGVSVSECMRFGFKIYDAEGVVVDSGTVSTNSLKVGDKFREEVRVAVYGSAPYRLELLDVT